MLSARAIVSDVDAHVTAPPPCVQLVDDSFDRLIHNSKCVASQ